MKIGQTTEALQAELLARAAARTAGQDGPPREVAPVEATDKVQLSDASRNLAASALAVNENKVEEVRAAISAGTFTVNVHAVADKMIHAAAELIESITTGSTARDK